MHIEQPLGNLRDGIGGRKPDRPVLAARSWHLVKQERNRPVSLVRLSWRMSFLVRAADSA